MFRLRRRRPAVRHPVLVALARRADEPLPPTLRLEDADDSAVRALLDIAPDLLTNDQLERSLKGLLGSLRRQTSDAVQGTVSFGGGSIAGMLALASVGLAGRDKASPLVAEAQTRSGRRGRT